MWYFWMLEITLLSSYAKNFFVYGCNSTSLFLLFFLNCFPVLNQILTANLWTKSACLLCDRARIEWKNTEFKFKKKKKSASSFVSISCGEVCSAPRSMAESFCSSTVVLKRLICSKFKTIKESNLSVCGHKQPAMWPKCK